MELKNGIQDLLTACWEILSTSPTLYSSLFWLKRYVAASLCPYPLRCRAARKPLRPRGRPPKAGGGSNCALTLSPTAGQTDPEARFIVVRPG